MDALGYHRVVNEFPPITRPEALFGEGVPAAVADSGRVAIAEVAGRDSAAAILRAVDEHGFDTLVATAAHTGTEYGDEAAPERAVTFLRERLSAREHTGPVIVTDLVRLGDPGLWSALNGRYASVLDERFSLWSPCLACHLYMHLLRVPLAWALCDVPIIAGERDTHDGRVKLSQTAVGIDATIAVLAYGGVELLEPVRDASGTDIEALVGPDWPQDGRQFGCVLSGNYEALDGSVGYDEAAHAGYVDGFLIPAGRAVVDALRSGEAPDWIAVVGDVLRG